MKDKDMGTPARRDTAPRDVLDQVHAAMDGIEWSSDTLDAICTILTDAGYSIRDSNDPLCACDNCEKESPLSALALIRDIEERVDFPRGDPRRVEPAGECPHCGALAYHKEDGDADQD